MKTFEEIAKDCPQQYNSMHSETVKCGYTYFQNTKGDVKSQPCEERECAFWHFYKEFYKEPKQQSDAVGLEIIYYTDDGIACTKDCSYDIKGNLKPTKVGSIGCSKCKYFISIPNYENDEQYVLCSYKRDHGNHEPKEEKQDLIMVPDNIKIQRFCSYEGDGLGIVFNSDKQVLYASNGLYSVYETTKHRFSKCHLVKVNKKDLKVNYTYFHTDHETTGYSKNELVHYCKYLGENEFVYIDDNKNIICSSNNWDHWYQVVPLEGE